MPERDLSLLIAAIHEPAGPKPETLVRYAENPESLSDAECAEVEEALSADPLLAGELRALQSSRAVLPIRAAEPPPRSFPASRRVNLCFVGPLAAVAAAALLVLAWVPELALAPAAPPLMQTSSLAPPTAPAPMLVPAAPEAPSTVPVADPLVEPVPPLPVRAVAVVEAPRPAPRAVEPEAPRVVALVPDPGFEPAPVPAPEPVLLAVLEPQYQAPVDAQLRYRIAGGTRAAAAQDADMALELLAPAHVALTRSPAPSLFWSLDSVPPASAVFSLTLSAAMTPEPLLERELTRPEHAGLQRIRLARYGIQLEPGVEYTWTISADVHGNVTLAQGWIQRSTAAQELPPAPDGARAAQYAAAGLWYDAVEALGDLADQHPGEPRIASALQALAIQARTN